jgi:transcriptional regulator with XRE-family HTH domain
LKRRSYIVPNDDFFLISDIERGTKSPTISTLAALAEALGVRITTLIEPAAPRVKIVRRSDQHLSVDPKTGAGRAKLWTGRTGEQGRISKLYPATT